MASGTSENKRQKRMGPAPIASFEDLSDEVRSRLESPDDKNLSGSVVRLPGIREDATPSSPASGEGGGISIIGAMSIHASRSPKNIKPPTMPRIDISRASSSSHHDSRESTPDKEIFDHDPSSAKLGLGFKEDGTLDLRSSTEELSFHEGSERRKSKGRAASPSLHDELINSNFQRKDSQCSDIVLLNISGRTSRLSSIGSQGSAQSRLSNASALSGQSGISRCSSPHKMVLETSFCGNKTPEMSRAVHQPGTKIEAEQLEKVILSRRHDPTKAILAEGITVAKPEKPARNQHISVKSDITIRVDEPLSDSGDSNKIPKSRHVSESGVEYFYIPLKGPLPPDTPTPLTISKPKLRECKSATFSPNLVETKTITKRSKSATPSPIIRKKEPKKPVKKDPVVKKEPKPVPKPKESEAQVIRIKLKPDHMYDDEPVSSKPDFLELERNSCDAKAESYQIKSISSSPTSPKRPDPNIESVTPSPSVSRRSSFASIFRSKETTPDSPNMKRKHPLTGVFKEASESFKERGRNRSKSKELDKISTSGPPSSTESIDSKTKQKSLLSLFKFGKKEIKTESESSSQETLPLEGIGKVEFKFNDSGNGIVKQGRKALEGESIRIPLHSPAYYENRILGEWKTSSQDSQETVIEAPSKRTATESNTEPPSKSIVNSIQSRQSSTSSENVVFSTNLGSNNDIFTTKLPKNKQEDVVKEVDIEVHEPVVNHNMKSPEMEKPKEEGKVEEDEVRKKNEKTERKLSLTKQSRVMEVTQDDLPKSSVVEEERNSSESERDSELEFPRNNKNVNLKLEFAEPELKGLVLQQDSFEDELPYVPTTLPQERSAAVPIVPINQRSTFEMKTCPIERPRSTTPINPSCLEEYCEEVMGSINVENITQTIEKLRISLPRNESFDKSASKIKSPRKSKNTWMEFDRKKTPRGESPPPLPPKGQHKEWINFEEIPEKRKPPKRIQTIPSRGHIDVPESVLQENIVYSYVNPEECKCECHEISARERDKRVQETREEDELPLLEDEAVEEEKVPEVVRLNVAASDCISTISDSSVELSISVGAHEANGLEASLRTPFTSDLGISSNRSSIVSQDEPQSPGSPNAFPKLS